MAELDIDNIALVERKKVGDDGRIYVGTENAGKEFKVILVDPDATESKCD